jgi:hypothetical protein
MDPAAVDEHPSAGDGPAASRRISGDMETLLRVALTHDALQQEVEILRDEAGRWACEFEAAVNVSMDLKEQVDVLHADHEKILNTPRSALDEGDAISYELARRKSEVCRHSVSADNARTNVASP